MRSQNQKQSPYLHLYGDDTLLRAVKNGRIPLQTDWSFLQPYLSFVQWHDRKQQPVSEQEILSALKAHYEKLPDTIRSLLSFEDFLQQRDKLEPDIRQTIRRKRRSGVQGYAVERLDKAAFLRLYSSALIDSAWQRHGAGFQGVCFCLRSDAALLTPKPGYPALLKPVGYGQAHQVAPSSENPVPGAFTGPETDAAEAEWRLVLPRGEAEVPSARLTKGDVVRIYLGPLADTELVKSVRHLVRFDQRFRHCDLFQVVPDVAHWKLTAQPLDPNTDDENDAP
ncbi:hypothetical protein [Reinekea blandensis]|uniref:Uncharacterized protein n=1 Tax=Reinekea blandensis MED297 TaxID=314283 RepID=A4BF00_9GAMM|nr:hypothetical protein [Reinekea blandensis]EAR09335.1 hypothetical protein MED297_18643 [Reinekea sp. MED297] [Reinekea blandensis MED297]